MGSAFARAASRPSSAGAIEASTISREVAEHIWPALKKMPPAMQSTA